MIKHRRKGIATAVYCQMEELLGISIHNELGQQTPFVKELGESTNRPFGKNKIHWVTTQNNQLNPVLAWIQYLLP
jgi:hypothetical protein